LTDERVSIGAGSLAMNPAIKCRDLVLMQREDTRLPESIAPHRLTQTGQNISRVAWKLRIRSCIQPGVPMS
jgi:hypothetical protein